VRGPRASISAYVRASASDSAQEVAPFRGAACAFSGWAPSVSFPSLKTSMCPN
jgi:hypothetical protein